MASISSPPLCFISSFNVPSNSNIIFPSKPSKPKHHHHHHHHHHHVSRVSCNNGGNQSNTKTEHNNNRRDVLIGLGGLYGATTLTNNIAIAAPLIPDFGKCGSPDLPSCPLPPTECCPPKPSSTNIIDFKPQPPLRLRVRPAAHKVDDKYLAKYKEALRRMKALPDDDPRSFVQQAAIHCAYCHGSYKQVGFPDLQLQVHGNWLFLPFHRLYIYFYERILGSLINDPTFAIPFWNYDNKEGMVMPSIFTDLKSPLYDPLRNSYHFPPNIIDLNYSPDTDECQGDVETNIKIMYNSIIQNGTTAKDFFGDAYRAGDDSKKKAAGSLENIPHNKVHVWVGDKNQPNGEDMGRLYSAGRDPLFYTHHANVDRIWSIWNDKLGKKNIDDPDWLQSEFLFYDENKNLVRVKVEDSLDTTRLGYKNQDVDIPWLNSRGKPAKSKAQRLQQRTLKPRRYDAQFPLILDGAPVSFELKRPRKSRSKKEKEELGEVLFFEGIVYDDIRPVNFDVIINVFDEDEAEKVKPKSSEFAGSFATVPHSGMSMKMQTNFKLSLTDLLEDLEADDDDSVVVTLVPKSGKRVKIQNIKIKLND